MTGRDLSPPTETPWGSYHVEPKTHSPLTSCLGPPFVPSRTKKPLTPNGYPEDPLLRVFVSQTPLPLPRPDLNFELWLICPPTSLVPTDAVTSLPAHPHSFILPPIGSDLFHPPLLLSSLQVPNTLVSFHLCCLSCEPQGKYIFDFGLVSEVTAVLPSQLRRDTLRDCPRPVSG